MHDDTVRLVLKNLFHLKGTPLSSGRVTQLETIFSKTYIFLLPTYLVYFVVH